MEKDKYIFDRHSAILTAIHEGKESEVDIILNNIYEDGFQDGFNEVDREINSQIQQR